MYPDRLTVQPIEPFDCRVTPPGSKSLTNRALLLAALADGESVVERALACDDADRMIAGLRGLGVSLTSTRDQRDSPASVVPSSDGGDVTVIGEGGRFVPPAQPIHTGNSGTTMRFLTAAAAMARGGCTLTGVERMKQRPIGELVTPMRELGVAVDYLEAEGFPPVLVHGGSLRGGDITLQPTLSSQFISALLHVAPLSERGVSLRFEGPITSQPYVAMTLRVMQAFGVEAEVAPDFSRISVAPQRYRPTRYRVEPDASNATYFLAAAAILPGARCTVEGLGARSVQGDVGFADVLHAMGAGLVYGADFITVIGPKPGEKLHGVDIDLADMPDTAQTLACVALYAQGPTTIRGVGNLRVKETDRLEALRAELTRVNARVEIDGDAITITPPEPGRQRHAEIQTYDDHRMAMSFALAGLGPGSPGVTILDPGCVAKTFPDYFEHLAKLTTGGNQTPQVDTLPKEPRTQ